MASLDASGSVAVRIVYDGPPAAGKTTSLQLLAARFGQGRVLTPEATTSGRTLFFDWLEYTGGRFEGRPIRCQIVSVPGQEELRHRRKHLLDSADAVVFVADTSRAGFQPSQRLLDQLLTHLGSRDAGPAGVVVQANKRDLPDALPLAQVRADRPLAIIESVASQGDGIREAFVFAVRLALDRVRELSSRGELSSTGEGDTAEQTLRTLKSLTLEAGARELWPTFMPAAEPTPAAEHSAAPRVPDASVPSGWVWPPIDGRMLLQEATHAPASSLRELAPGEWLGDSESGWRFHSPAGGVFHDADTARAALIRWAQAHTALSGWVSRHRCIALCDDGDGRLRLWQIVRNEPSLWQQLSQALASMDRQRAHQALDQVSRQVDGVSEHWPRAPFELPCTLETVGIDGAFISLLPEASKLERGVSADRGVKLRHQLEAMRSDHQLGGPPSPAPPSS